METLQAIAAELPAVQEVESNPAAVYLSSLSTDASRRSMHGALKRALVAVGVDGAAVLAFRWDRMQYQHVQAMRTALLAKHSPSSVNHALAAVIGVVREAWKLGQVDGETLRRVESVERVRHETLPAGRALSLIEAAELFEACDETTPKGARDAAILAVLLGCGLRRSELVSLDLADLNGEEVRVRQGKGNKDRLAFLNADVRDALDRWLVFRGEGEGPLFVRLDRGGKPTGARLTAQSVRYVLKALGELSGVDASPHDLRRSFVTAMLDSGADLLTVSKLAGHSSPDTTRRYDRRGDEVAKQAVQRLPVPVRGRR